MLLQAITIHDQIYEQALSSVDFIQRFIFPGSFIPSVTAHHGLGAPRDGHEGLPAGGHRPALRDDAQRLARALLRAPGRGPRRSATRTTFIRMWEFYLCYCEGGFLERQIGDVQMLLTKPRCRLPAA